MNQEAARLRRRGVDGAARRCWALSKCQRARLCGGRKSPPPRAADDQHRPHTHGASCSLLLNGGRMAATNWPRRTGSASRRRACSHAMPPASPPRDDQEAGFKPQILLPGCRSLLPPWAAVPVTASMSKQQQACGLVLLLAGRSVRVRRPPRPARRSNSPLLGRAYYGGVNDDKRGDLAGTADEEAAAAGSAFHANGVDGSR